MQRADFFANVKCEKIESSVTVIYESLVPLIIASNEEEKGMKWKRAVYYRMGQNRIEQQKELEECDLIKGEKEENTELVGLPITLTGSYRSRVD